MKHGESDVERQISIIQDIHLSAFGIIFEKAKEALQIYIGCQYSSESALKFYSSLLNVCMVKHWNLLTWSKPKGLWFDNKFLLVVPKFKQVTYIDHVFLTAAPRLWNILPVYI